MKVNAGHSAFNLVEADVIESFEASTGYRPDAMVGNKEMLLPAHEDVVAFGEIPICKIRSLCLFG